jgi:hypothetical protein
MEYKHSLVICRISNPLISHTAEFSLILPLVDGSFPAPMPEKLPG